MMRNMNLTLTRQFRAYLIQFKYRIIIVYLLLLSYDIKNEQIPIFSSLVFISFLIISFAVLLFVFLIFGKKTTVGFEQFIKDF